MKKLIVILTIVLTCSMVLAELPDRMQQHLRPTHPDWLKRYRDNVKTNLYSNVWELLNWAVEHEPKIKSNTNNVNYLHGIITDPNGIYSHIDDVSNSIKDLEYTTDIENKLLKLKVKALEERLDKLEVNPGWTKPIGVYQTPLVIVDPYTTDHPAILTPNSELVIEPTDLTTTEGESKAIKESE